MMKEYESQVTPWSISEDDFPAPATGAEKLTFLLRYAILAPSSHNTQPWLFEVEDDEIRIFVDPSRWLQVADADQRELHISIGCALETLLVAAEHFGYGHGVTLFPVPSDETLAAVVEFTPQGEPAPFRPEALFDAIPERHTNHRPYDPPPIPAEDLEQLQACVVADDLDLYMTGDADIKRQVDELIVRGDALQFSDPAWREELGYWIGQGVFGQSWLTSKMGQLAVTYLNMSKGTAKKDSELLMSAPVLAVITSEEDGRRQQVEVGQAFQRLSLMATALGIRVHPMSQILEFEELKAEVAALVPQEGVVPQHTFRMGYAEAEEHTPRRPLAEVLV